MNPDPHQRGTTMTNGAAHKNDMDAPNLDRRDIEWLLTELTSRQ